MLTSNVCARACTLSARSRLLGAQSISALRLAFEQDLTPVLFINKLDRLVLELKMDTMEAFVCLTRVLEQVNAFCGVFRHQAEDVPVSGACDETTHAFYFDPRKGNVIFGSALDGWAFR